MLHCNDIGMRCQSRNRYQSAVILTRVARSTAIATSLVWPTISSMDLMTDFSTVLVIIGVFSLTLIFNDWDELPFLSVRLMI